jgi:catechol 2,3-dioxygenase-like lactoylglutathione lyase family enzyme
VTQVQRLLGVGLTVSDLDRLARFYEEALGFDVGPESPSDSGLCQVFGVRGMRSRRARWGAQEIELTVFDPPGAPYPKDANAADLVFQHCAIVVADIEASHRRLLGAAPAAISRGGPVRLPERSGGVTAFKFRDPDGHPLELIAFPMGRPEGIDHSAIAVADAARSIGFYEGLGLRVASRQLNEGPEQDALDGLDEVAVDVVGLAPPMATPHVELLAYRHPRGRGHGMLTPQDVAATRLVFEAEVDSPHLVRDPDGHTLLILPT